jgi:hypothetical protein
MLLPSAWVHSLRAIGEHRPHGVGVYAGAIANNVRRRCQATHASETQRMKQALVVMKIPNNTARCDFEDIPSGT